MNLKQALIIVINMAESKYLYKRFSKITKEQEKALRIVSAYIEHGKFDDNEL